MRIKFSKAEVEYFRKQGAKGGRIGGKVAAAKMTAKERTARAKKAGAASAKVRAKKPGKSK